MRKILLGLVAASMLLGATVASAASLKIGVIDLPQILQQSPQVTAINKNLQSEFAKQQQQIVTAQKNLQKEAGQLSPTATTKLSSADKTKLEQKIQSDQKALQQMVATFQENVSKAQTQAMDKFMQEVDATVKSIAQKQSLDMVVLKPALIYSANTVDITTLGTSQITEPTVFFTFPTQTTVIASTRYHTVVNTSDITYGGGSRINYTENNRPGANHISTARMYASAKASNNPGKFVYIWYRGGVVEKFWVGTKWRSHDQLNEFVTNTINRN